MAEIANPVGNTFTANVRVVFPPKKRSAGAKEVLEFRVANKCSFKADAPAFFFDVTIWGEKDQEKLANLQKGEIISVTGCLVPREFPDKKNPGVMRREFTLDRAYVSRLEKPGSAPVEATVVIPDDQGDDPLAGI